MSSVTQPATTTDGWDLARHAEERAIARARTNPDGIGASFLWRPAGGAERLGWWGMALVSDGETTTEVLISTARQSRHATPNPDRLAIALERLFAAQDGTIADAAIRLGRGGLGLDLDAHGALDVFR